MRSAKKRKHKEAIIASLGKTEAGENGPQDSEIPAPSESMHGKWEYKMESVENGVQDSEIPTPGESIRGKSECNTEAEEKGLPDSEIYIM